jgi:hypothetical protein
MRKAMVLSFTAALLFHAANIEARPQRVDQIPNGSVNGCANCHLDPAGGGPRNGFGQAVVNGFLLGSGASASVVWSPALAALDSDGDGFSNGTELGDPDGDGTPVAGSQATATNPGNASSLPQVANSAPVFAALSAQSVKEGALLSLTVSASDANKDAVTLSATNLPAGATFSGGKFSWTPGFDQSGDFTVSFTATDGKDQTTATVMITVENVNRPLTVSSVTPTRTLIVGTAGDTVRVSVFAASPDRPNLTYAWQVNGTAISEATSSYLFTVSSGATDDILSVTIGDGSESLVRSWTVTQVLVGDLNGNNSVDFPDFLLFVSAFGKTSADAGFIAAADINGNGRVDFPDFLSFVSFFGLKK